MKQWFSPGVNFAHWQHWQYLRTLLIVATEEGGGSRYWHLMGRGQGCCTSYNSENNLHKEESAHLNINSATIGKPCS